MAGGKSRRMGVDKAGIVLAGKTLLEHVLDQAASWGGNRILVAGPPRDWARAEYIPDPPEHQPSSLRGFYAGLIACSSPWALITGCDMPFVKGEVVSCLWAAKNAGGAVAWWQNRRQPLPGFYPRQGAEIIAAMLADNRFHLAGLLDRLQPAVARDIARVDPEGISFFNINSPDDLDLAERMGRR
ncbi:MAG: molybdenum cofactor guanylyltransferase [Eubacteriales bacterium]|nr:molybdenum cofactor guanylyltransferase [Eubacteriales bacterium]